MNTLMKLRRQAAKKDNYFGDSGVRFCKSGNLWVRPTLLKGDKPKAEMRNVKIDGKYKPFRVCIFKENDFKSGGAYEDGVVYPPVIEERI